MKTLKFKKYTTTFELTIIDKINIDSLEIESIIDNYENIFSRFLEYSELSIINKNGGGIMSPLFLKLLKKNIDLYNFTDGFFNPLICIEDIGYTDKQISENKITNYDINKNIIINGNTVEIKNGLKLDFGGSAKGFIVDILVSYLKKIGANNFYINFGGDIYLSGKNNGKKWKIGIENPFLENKDFGIIELENKSISTSGRYKRNWQIDGKDYHHILNPKTLKNENEIIMLSIIGNKTFFTDSLATAVFNMRINTGIQFLNANNIDGLIISKEGIAHFSLNFTKKYNFKK